jgi:hypothetical protein
MGRSRHTPSARACWNVLLIIALVATTGRPAPAAQAALSTRIANYSIAARYDAQAHTITAQERLTWHNTAPDVAPDLYFHLYLNAFANDRSSFVRAAGEQWVEWLRLHPHGWGYITIKSIRIGGSELRPALQFVHPDDDNIDDRTVVRLPLDTPVPAGGTVEVDIDFVAQLPRVAARTGYAGPFTFAGQWFPKIGVYEDGAWNCHQYHLTTEFFADFGVYDVTLTVPRDGVVGATGTLRDEHDNGDGTKTLHFVAEDVHDFAWTIDPRFQAVTAEVDGTTVRLLIQPQHVRQIARHLDAAKAALTRYRTWIGAYPYPQLTIVDPGPGALGAGGMEYPTLITVGTTWWMPPGLRLPELVTVHEFGHQYWYGMVASNEFEEAWLDEGVNSYLEGRIMDEAFGPASYVDLFGVHLDSVPLQRLRYLADAQHDPMVRQAWRFVDRASYSAISYSKTALVLDTLDGYLGKQTLRSALAAYCARWRFRHPRGGDFLAAINEAAGQDLTWYFDQVISGTGVLDYAVTRVDVEAAQGFAGHPVTITEVGDALPLEPAEPRRYHSEVVVERLGSVRMPVDVQVVFEDGTTAAEHWDGRDRWKRFEYTGAQRVEWAVVDPKATMPLDIDRLNNSRMREGGTRGIVRLTARWGFWFQNLIYFLTGL